MFYNLVSQLQSDSKEQFKYDFKSLILVEDGRREDVRY